MQHHVGLVARKPDLLHANIKGADQPAHTHSLISTFVIRLLKSIIFKLASCKISVSIAEQVGLSLTRSETTKPGFLATKAYMIKGSIIYL